MTSTEFKQLNDIVSKEILENAINNYEGTVLYVSHDRYFINQTAHRILELENQSLTGYLGNYDYYLEKKLQLTGTNAMQASLSGNHYATVTSCKAATTAEDSEGKADWKAQKEQQAKQRKLENDFKKTEAEIEALETRQTEIDAEMASPDICTNVAKLTELSREKETLEAKLSSLYETWELLSEQIQS